MTGNIMESERQRCPDETRTSLMELGSFNIVNDMKNQDFDSLKYATYRTACKLRFVQKRTYLNLVDIWNIIEAFRENGFNTLEPHIEVNISRLETLLSSIYFQLNKRLPSDQQIKVASATSSFLSWLVNLYDLEDTGKMKVFSVKIALATLCAGKLTDKLRYVFSQLSDSNGHMLPHKYADYLRSVVAIPAAVGESLNFFVTESTASHIFEGRSRVTVNDFLNHIMTEPGQDCLVWLTLLHRLIVTESVFHPIKCSACGQDGFTGFRYKCQQCPSYQLCQWCFWRGNISPSHTSDHPVKEYATFKTSSGQLSRSLRKSFKCVPEKAKPNIPRYPERPEKTIDLTHIIPPSPLPVHSEFSPYSRPSDVSSIGSTTNGLCSSPPLGTESMTSDDEHRLIAQYACKLDKRGLKDEMDRRHLLNRLEARNQEMMKEIKLLRLQTELEPRGGDPMLLDELRSLRGRKFELETHLMTLQESRKDLMIQLEGLMKVLKAQSPQDTSLSTTPEYPSSFQTADTTYHTDSSKRNVPGGLDGDALWCEVQQRIRYKDGDGDISYYKPGHEDARCISGLTTDEESYVRTDDDEDEGGFIEWDEARKRWINR